MSCPHQTTLKNLQPPKLSQSVHREECTQCFDDQDSPQGIDICLSCFNGGCPSANRHHARTHAQRSDHNWTLNIKRNFKDSWVEQKKKQKTGDGDPDGEPPAKMTKLAIVQEREEDKYDWTTQIKCWRCDPSQGKVILSQDLEDTETVKKLVEGVMTSMSSGRQSEVQAWEEEINPCEHALILEQEPMFSDLTKCTSCDLTSNLWLCLTCGSLGCGRQQYGGIGGNSHGIAHYESTGHPVSVKLGTITPEGNADLHCYKCNEATLSPNLASQLAVFGINVLQQTKTEKSLTELQIEHNLSYDFSVSDEKTGKLLTKLYGSSLTGLSNLGNSCYMASVLQVLFALPSFRQRYGGMNQHAEQCTELLPAECLECQLRKIGDGLVSGRYSVPDPALSLGSSHSSPALNPNAFSESQTENEQKEWQRGLRPTTFKALVGRGHVEFSTMRQQDSEEFLSYLLTSVRRDLHKRRRQSQDLDPTAIFSFGMEQRLQCRPDTGGCAKVRYRVDGMDVLSVAVPARIRDVEKDESGKETPRYEPVELMACIKEVLGSEFVDGWQCPSCSGKGGAWKQQKFASFPDTFVVHAKKFQLVNWVPTKLDVPVLLPQDDVLRFEEKDLGKGLAEGEQTLPEDSAGPSVAKQEVQFNEDAMVQLTSMGFSELRAKKALLATGNGTDAEVAMNWLLEHMDDPDIDDPIPATGGGAPAVSEEQISMLAEMGFTHAQAKKALSETNNNAERAIEWLFNHPDDDGTMETAPSGSAAESTAPDVGGTKSTPVTYRLKAFISHKGPSVHSGHYVAHIRDVEGSDGGWILFNDEKVVKADEASVDELKKGAYLYFFKKI